MPQRTIALLDELEALGFQDADFALLHPMSRVTIAKHREYCKTVRYFSAKKNVHVRERLELVLQRLKHRGITAPVPAGLFAALANEASAEIPQHPPAERAAELIPSPNGDGRVQSNNSVASELKAGTEEGQYFDDELLSAFLGKFFGYGNLKADFWFIGMEQDGGVSVAEISRRLSIWDERGRKSIEDFRAYHDAIGERRWLLWQKLQPTAGKLIRIMLSVQGKRFGTKDVRAYQMERLGRLSGDTCFLDLLPLPAPATSHWAYKGYSRLRELTDRTAYETLVGAKRMENLTNLIADSAPKYVVFYGFRYRESWWKKMAPVSMKPVPIGDGKAYIGKNETTVFAVSKHPVAAGVNNAYFYDVGQAIRRFANR